MYSNQLYAWECPNSWDLWSEMNDPHGPSCEFHQLVNSIEEWYHAKDPQDEEHRPQVLGFAETVMFFLFDRPRSLNPPIYKQLGRFWRCFLSPSKMEPNRPAEVCCQQFLQTRPAGLWLWPLPIGHHQCGADHLSAGRWRDWGPFGSQRFFQRRLHQGTERRGLKSHDRPAEESTVMKEFIFESG